MVATTIQKIMYRNTKTGVLATLPHSSGEIKSNSWNFDTLENTARISAEEVQDGTYVPVTATLRVELISQVDRKVVRKQKLTDEVYTFMVGSNILNYREKYHGDWKRSANYNKDHFASRSALFKTYSQDRSEYNKNPQKLQDLHRYAVINDLIKSNDRRTFKFEKNEDKTIYIVKVKRTTKVYPQEYEVLEKRPLSDFPELLI